MQTSYAIFGGSFNPIHKGHVSIVQHLASLDNDKIIIIPTSCSPFKIQNSRLPNNLRFEMVQCVFQDWENIIITDFELQTNQIQYTFHTLEHLQTYYPNGIWRLVIGFDTYQDFSKWKNAQWITNNASLWIVHRLGLPLPDKDLEEILISPISKFYNNLYWNPQQRTLSNQNREIVRILDCTPPQISSTEIRAQVNNIQWIPQPALRLYKDFVQQSSSIKEGYRKNIENFLPTLYTKN